MRAQVYRIGFWMLMVLLAACHRPAETRRDTSIQSSELLAVDSLLWTQPDSALTCLMACYDTIGDRHYANLLLAELLYKNDYEQTNRAELQVAVAYYDSVSCPFLAARAHYINGVGYYERDSVVPACEEYLKAVEIMEEHFTEKELVGQKAKFMAYSFNRLGDLFSKQFMMEPSIECYENALFFCEIEPTTPNGVSNILYRIGVQYDKKEEPEKARLYFVQAIEGLKNTDNLLSRDIVSSKALVDYQLGIESAQILEELRQIDKNAINEKERLNRFLTIGAIFKEEEEYDSALCYFVPVFQSETDVISKIRAAESLRVIYDSLGNKDKMEECLCYLAYHKKPEGESKALVSMLDNIYKNYLNKKQEKKAAIEKQSSVWRIGEVGVFILLLMAAVIVVVMKFRNSRRMKAQEMVLRKRQTEAEKALAEKNKQLEREKKARQRDKEKHQQVLQQREEQVRTLENALDQHCSMVDLRREAFLKEEICTRINDNVRSQHITARNASKISVTFTDEDAMALKDVVLKHYDNFESVLLGKYPKMSHEDLQLCQLFLLGLDERQIAVIQCKTYSAIKKRVVFLEKMMEINESLSSYILSF